MNGPPRIRILIADDHPAIREGLVTILGRQPDMEVVGVATDGLEAIDLYRLHRPDIVVMDIRMPGCDGITATRTIVNEFPEARVVAMTIDADELRYRALAAGAATCLVKDVPRQIWFATIRSLVSWQDGSDAH